MNDPIAAVLDQLKRNRRVQAVNFQRNRTFLHNVADVFEREGFATTELFLHDKQRQVEIRDQASVLLDEVLPALKACDRIRENRAIGRYIIKSLASLQTDRREGKR